MLSVIRNSIPALPEQLIERYTQELKLPEYDARVLTDDKETADFFEELIKQKVNPKSASNWLLGPVKSWLNQENLTIDKLGLAPEKISALIELVDKGKLNFSMASSRLFPAMLREPNAWPADLAALLNLIQDAGSEEIALWVQEALDKMPEKVLEYRNGKKGLIGLFVGEVKRLSKGKADPKLTNKLLLEKLDRN